MIAWYAHTYATIRHQVRFCQLDSTLPARFAYHLSHVLLQFPIRHPPSTLGDDDNMVFSFAAHVEYIYV
jgi:hypothetical protein